MIVPRGAAHMFHATAMRRGPRAGVGDYLAENLVVAIDSVLGCRGLGGDRRLRVDSRCAVWCSGASKPPGQCAGRVCSGCERVAAASVTVQGEAVDHERVAEKVERLA